MEETETPMFQSTRSAENEMEEILSEKKDPVSGNIAPVGATPEEVRDDIPIMASPNEFMIDAATRRYYGTPFFENLQAAAKQGFQRIKKGEESFFRDDELEIEEAAEKVTSSGSPQKLQGGGEVDEVPGSGTEIPTPTGGGFGGYGGAGLPFGGFEYKYYIHPSKPRIQVVFFNGRPLSPIPEGYVLEGAETIKAVEAAAPSDDDGGSEPPQIPTWANTDVSEWELEGRGMKLWQAYGSKKGVGVDPLGKVIAGIAAVTFTGPGAIYTGPKFVQRMETEHAKKAQAILEAAQGKLKTETDPEKIKIYEDAIKVAQAEIDHFKEKKPFSWRDLIPGLADKEDDPVITPQVIVVPDDGSAPPGTDPGFVDDEGQIIKPKIRPPQQTTEEEEEEDGPNYGPPGT